MQYQNREMSVLGFHVESTERSIREAITHRGPQIDFGPKTKGSFTIIASMTFPGDGSVHFGGLTGEHRLSVDVSPERVLAHWKGFTETQREQHEIDERHRREQSTVARGKHA